MSVQAVALWPATTPAKPAAVTDGAVALWPATAPASWRAAAACTGSDPAVFYVERGEPSAPARAVCAGCPVNVDCLTDALDRGEQFGIWGGLAPDHRRRIMGTTDRGDYRAAAARAVAAMTVRSVAARAVIRRRSAERPPPPSPAELAERRARFAPVADRVLARTARTAGGCWIFAGAHSAKGYGYVNVDGTAVGAHIVVHEAKRGPVPDGWHVHHRCGVRGCVRPDHLRAVTPRENDRLARAQRAPWNVPCPSCSARPGRPCRSIARRAGRRPGRPVRAHHARQLAARPDTVTSSPPTPGDRRQLVLVLVGA